MLLVLFIQPQPSLTILYGGCTWRGDLARGGGYSPIMSVNARDRAGTDRDKQGKAGTPFYGNEATRLTNPAKVWQIAKIKASREHFSLT